MSPQLQTSNTLKYILACCLVGYITPALSAPIISSVSGALSHGSSITISGSNFGTKVPAKPIYWADFESGINPSPLGQKTTWDEINPLSEVSTDMARQNSSRTLKWNAGSDTDNTNGGGGTGGVALFSFDSDRLYVAVKRRYEFDIRNYGVNLKVFRLWWDIEQRIDTSWPHNDMYTGTPGGSSWLTGAEHTGLESTWTDEPMPTFRWMNQELVYKASSINGQDGIYHFLIDGQPFTGARSNYRMRTTQYPNMYNDFYLHDDFSNATVVTPNLWMYYDDIYVDNTWARVIVGNAPTWNQTTKREVQIPSQWSSNSITITVNMGGFVSLGGAYLYVVDHDGNVNNIGHPLCPTCPMPSIMLKP